MGSRSSNLHSAVAPIAPEPFVPVVSTPVKLITVPTGSAALQRHYSTAGTIVWVERNAATMLT
jgi:hypothetical protein